MKCFINCCCLFICLHAVASAQNVGIGIVNPSEKLDVAGSINLKGQLKLNGDSGRANQVLMKNANNQLSWAELASYKNFKVIDCYNIANTAGNDNCTATVWTVPAGVSTIMLECWGGGGGASTMCGGASGGYVLVKVPVTTGTNISVAPGAGGNSSLNSNGVNGGVTEVSIPGNGTIYAYGGDGGQTGDVLNGTGTFGTNYGGGVIVTNASLQYIPMYGYSGTSTHLSYAQVSSTVFAKKIDFGDGGDAPLYPGSGGKGGYTITSTLQTQYLLAGANTFMGAGGGADSGGGKPGRGGRVIIHW